ncbi:hypothetical protein AC1031_020448 [Aphanomyces cochlioides]|nr:hypothetical protein AC1031_020448 [Aphanomyces cochlioides]
MANKSSRGRGKGWCPASVDVLLDQVEKFLPIGRNGWEKVEHAFNISDFVQRDVDALKRKFVVLKNNPKPTGDPDCPPDVARAKRINREIDNKASVLSFEDDQESRQSEDEYDEEEPLDIVAPPQEKPNRTGMGSSELSELRLALKRKQQGDAGGMSYVTKKRLSLDKFIDKVTSNNDKMSSDMMTVMLMMDQRAAEREERRAERDMQWKQEQMQFQMAMEERRIERECCREETQMLLMAKLFKEK